MAIVQSEKSLDQNYTDLLVRLREIANQEQSGSSICAWCGSPKNAHLPDGRCSTWAISKYFTSRRAKEREAVERGLVLVEELRRL